MNAEPAPIGLDWTALGRGNLLLMGSKRSKSQSTPFSLAVSAFLASEGIELWQLAQRAGMDKETLARWKRGRLPGQVEVVARLAKAMGTTVEDLVDPDAAAPLPSTKDELQDWVTGLSSAEAKAALRAVRNRRESGGEDVE